MKHQLLGMLAFVLTSSSLLAADPDRILFTFDHPEAAKPWQTVNDGVMGGRSVGRFKVNADQEMEFSGTLSLENNGGFASVRASRGSKLAMQTGDVIVARVRGDGREYNFNLYAQKNLGGYSYRQSFQTKRDQWIEVELPLNDSLATWRGRTYPNEKLDPSEVTGLGFLLVTDKNFQMKGRYETDCSLGIEAFSGGRLLVGDGQCVADKGCTGTVRTMKRDSSFEAIRD